MSKDNTSIHEIDYELICEYFALIDRQGPGSPDITLKALSFIDKLSDESLIADIGCGTGGQTMVLAQKAPGKIKGIDLFPVFINQFNSSAKKMNLADRVHGIIASMDNLPFDDQEFDLLWSEGAIYNIGYEQGLKEWRRYLKTGGYIAVTDACWFTKERPDEIERFWLDAYPGIDTIPNRVKQMHNADYMPVASFILPEECWTDNFYVPQVKAQKIFMEKHKGNKMAQELVEGQRHEAQLYDKYKDYYGYAFFIGKKL